MKNYEKYVDKIKEYGGNNFCSMFIEPHILKPIGLSCGDLACGACRVLQVIWLTEELKEEPKEPEIDWSKVEVDTPILVRDSENTEWLKKHFAKYEDGIVYVWNLGRTSWTAPHDKSVSAWQYAKLIEGEKEHKEPRVDWNKVEVDTPILVRDYEDSRWVRRCFAKYENGIIYAWQAGCTSQSIAVHMIKWNYAKLIENEETK